MALAERQEPYFFGLVDLLKKDKAVLRVFSFVRSVTHLYSEKFMNNFPYAVIIIVIQFLKRNVLKRKPLKEDPMVYAFIILVVIIFFIDGIPLIKKKRRAELTVFWILIALSCLLLIFEDSGLPVTLKSLNEIFYDYGKSLFG